MNRIQLHKRVNKKLAKTKQLILNSFERTLTLLELNPYLGDLIPRKNISKKVILFYSTNKLFRLPLTNYWRLVYTVIKDENKTVVLILEFFNHKDYNKRFGYK
ncbi:hypothetical protein H8D36_07620 [archaeon]|nr:hypothetical protein [archaeon]MBL7057330.1 hypothetical protein [Candidatus Woesearchaeota archaeon]